MKYLVLIGTIVLYLIQLFLKKVESDEARKKEKEVVLNEAHEAIKSGDPSRVTLSFGRLRRL